MATWTDDPATTSTHIRALHINELRGVVDQLRALVSLPYYTWTDGPSVFTSTHAQAGHFTELRSAIQDLWTAHDQGSLPPWSAGSDPSSSRQLRASDINDLRSWVNTVDPGTQLTGPQRGIHLRNASDLRSVDLMWLNQYRPGLVVVLSNVVADPNMLQYLLTINGSAEIYVRLYPTYAPVLNSYSVYDPTYQYTYNYDTAPQMDPDGVAAEIVAAANNLIAQGLTNFSWYPGNEPEIEWASDGNRQWQVGFWQDVQHYYTDIYYAVMDQMTQPFGLFPPAFTQFSSIAQQLYRPDGSVLPAAVDSPGPAPFTGADGDYGVNYCQDMLNLYGGFNQHNYFWPGFTSEQAVKQFWPPFLQSFTGKVRITECGWIPDALTDCPTSYCCPGDLDSTATSCDGSLSGISAAGDYNKFLRTDGGLGGYAVWLLSSSSGFAPQVAIEEDGTVRPWFQTLIDLLNGS